MHYTRFYIYPMWAYLNDLLHSAGISLSRSSLKMSCTPQTKFFHECSPSQLEACNHCTAYSQPMNLVQTEPKLTVQIAKTAFVIIPSAEEINRAISPLLKHRPTSTGCFLITEHFKFAQTIRIDFIHSTDLVTGLVDFSAVLVNWKRNDNPIIIFFVFTCLLFKSGRIFCVWNPWWST